MTNQPVMETWHTEDKTGWLDGPWQNEPDKAVWVDPATNLDCMIKRGPSGALCGYVGVDPTHPLFEVEYNQTKTDDPDDYDYLIDADVHGGLTYSRLCQEFDEKPETRLICHTAKPGRSSRIWWFGFDCAHCNDYRPRSEAITAKACGTPIDPP